MAKITTTGYLKLENKTDKDIRFVPYKENFATTIKVGNALVLGYETVGQYFYYMKQVALGLTVTVVDGKEAETDAVKVISVPSEITITNTGKTAVAFIPYRENFQVDVAAGETFTFEAKTAGQCIYYLNQGTETLTVVDAKEGN